MRSPLDALQTPTPVDFRRVAREFHSVAEQASFATPFVRLQVGFWRVLGRFREVQMDEKLYFSEVFRGAVTDRDVELNFR